MRSDWNLPPGVTVGDVSPEESALDMGLTLFDWDEADPDGFDRASAAALACEAGDTVRTLLEGGAVYCSVSLRARMEKALREEVNQNARWVLNFVKERTGGERDRD